MKLKKAKTITSSHDLIKAQYLEAEDKTRDLTYSSLNNKKLIAINVKKIIKPEESIPKTAKPTFSLNNNNIIAGKDHSRDTYLEKAYTQHDIWINKTINRLLTSKKKKIPTIM